MLTLTNPALRDPLQKILQYCGPETLANVSEVNTDAYQASKNDQVWKVVAEKISVPHKESDTPFYQSVKSYIINLKRAIRNFPAKEIPKEIITLLENKNPPSFEDIDLLQKFSKARDTIKVRKKLAAQALIGVDLSHVFSSAKNAIDTAKDFSTWLDENQSSLSSLTDLALDDSQLTHLPSEICELTQLQMLDLGFNQLTDLPSEICKLTQLQVLLLSNNQLTHLPSEICKLTQLQVLHLNNNQLKHHFPSEICELTQLGTLLLRNNQLTHLPPKICALTQLGELDLSVNQLKYLSSEVYLLPQLQYLDLRNNQLKYLSSEVYSLPQLRRLYLQLDNNKLSILCRIRMIANRIKIKPSTKILLAGLTLVFLYHYTKDFNPIIESVQNIAKQYFDFS